MAENQQNLGISQRRQITPGRSLVQATEPPVIKPGRIRPRLVVFCQLTHQLADSQPTGLAIRFSRFLQSDGHPFRYPGLKITGAEWRAVPNGFVDHPGYVGIDNQAKPTGDPATEPVIELQLGTGVFLIGPGEGFFGRPADFSSLKVRCPNGEALAEVIIFPE